MDLGQRRAKTSKSWARRLIFAHQALHNLFLQTKKTRPLREQVVENRRILQLRPCTTLHQILHYMRRKKSALVEWCMAAAARMMRTELCIIGSGRLIRIRTQTAAMATNKSAQGRACPPRQCTCSS